jgi:hypothetical protein
MDYHERVSIVTTNDSDDDVWFSHYSPNQIDPPNNWEYDDLLFREDYVCYNKTIFHLVKSHTSSFIFDEPTKYGWEWVRKNEYPDSLRIQVWKDDLIQEEGWEDFLKNFGKNHTYELEYVIDLEYYIENDKLRYTIDYPPSVTEDYMRIVYPKPNK